MQFLSIAALLACLLLLLPLLRWALTVVIRRRLGGYVHVSCNPNPALPVALTEAKRVAVLGGGVAGLTAAVTLARRGYAVTLFEKNAHLGGKLGSWQVELEPGRKVWVSHGFHAFFHHYHNLNRFLDSLGLRRGFLSIGDYVILARDGTTQRFADLQTTPILNLLSMWRKGAFSLGDAMAAPGRDCYGVFLEYDGDRTLERYDHLSFADFATRAAVPRRLLLAFNTFARAFFSDTDHLSLAELIKSFHFYYLSHDGGLVYQFPPDDYEPSFLAPLRQELAAHGAVVRLSTPVEKLSATDGGFDVEGETFDRIIVASDVVGTQRLFQNAEGLPAELTDQLGRLRPGQRYAVLRIWTDRGIDRDLPVFVITEKVRVLDSVTLLSRFEESAQKDAAPRGQHVLELHCYSVPCDLTEEEVRSNFIEELIFYFPELDGMQIFHEVWQLKQDFTAFHVGLGAERPPVETGVFGLYCCGDWVKLPFPAMLLEAACSSGMLAANGVLRADGLREELVLSVPPRGLMAGLPEPPGRRVLFSNPPKRPGSAP